MKIVLATNVLVSGVLKPHSIPGSILNAVLDERVSVLVDDRILFEHRGAYVTAPPVAEELSDPADLPFYEVAIAGVADFLVTGNRRRFPYRHFIASPREFISTLRSHD